MTQKVPAAKAKVAKSTLKSVVKTTLKSNHLLWLQWQTARDKYLWEQRGIRVLDQRKGLKEMLVKLMSGNQTHRETFIKGKGLESLKEALHVFCEAKLASQPNAMQKKC